MFPILNDTIYIGMIILKYGLNLCQYKKSNKSAFINTMKVFHYPFYLNQRKVGKELLIVVAVKFGFVSYVASLPPFLNM